MAKKLKKAILAGLTAYAASKALSGKGDWRKDLKHTYGKKPIIQDALTGDGNTELSPALSNCLYFI